MNTCLANSTCHSGSSSLMSIKVQRPHSLDLKKPFPERKLLPRRGLTWYGVGDQASLPRHALLGDTDSMWVTCLAGSRHRPGRCPSFCPSLDSPWEPAQSVQEGHAEVLKKPLIKIARETPHPKAGNSRENTSHVGSEGPAQWGGTSC